MPPLLAMASIWRPARHELCPCYVRPIAAAIDEPAFKYLTIPAIRAPRGMNFVHTSRDYPLQELSKLFQLCGRVGHRHFYRKDEFQKDSSFCIYRYRCPLSLWCRLCRNPHGHQLRRCCVRPIAAGPNEPPLRSALWESRSSPLL